MYTGTWIAGAGSGTLTGTTNLTVTDARVKSTSKIFPIGKGVLTALSIGQITIVSVSSGSFVINSNIALDVRAFDYFIIQQD